MDKIVTTKLNSKAEIIPSTLKPSTNALHIKTIIALTTKANKPSVKMVSGIVNNKSRGFKKTFKKPITIVTIMAVEKLVKCTPGNKCAARKTERL